MSASAPYLKRHDNGIFYVHWTEGRVGKRISTGAKEMAAAKAFFGSWLLMERNDLASNQGERGGSLTVADVWSVYDKKHLSIGVVNRYTADLAWKLLEPEFGASKVSEVSQMSVDGYVQKRTSGRLGRPVKPQTAARELSFLIAALNFAADKKQAIVAPALINKVDLPAGGPPRDRWLKRDEIQRLLDAAGRMRRGARLSRGERFLWLALETAARQEAILELTWDRVDFETNTIHYDVPGRKQTKKRRAVVPISSALRPVLLRAFDEKTGDHVLDSEAAVWSSIQLIAIEAGFSDQAKPKTSHKPKATGISPHVLRHTAATHMARRGVPLWKIAKILGNTLAMVEKVYAKWAPDDLREAVDLISKGELETTE